MAPATRSYPGVDLPLRHISQDGKPGVDFYRLGSFPGLDGTESPLLFVREVAMLLLMERLTDKPRWHEKVFDDAIVAKWRREALTQDETDLYNRIVEHPGEFPMPKRTRIINERTFDYCIAELRCKAAHFKETGLVFTLNVGDRTAIKSDSVLPDELRHGLKAAFEKLRAEQAAEPDWHPGTDDMVLDLVHPSLYSFIYGRSSFIREEVVGVADAITKWAGKGTVLPEARTEPLQRPPAGSSSSTSGTPSVHSSFWSPIYQWLPANLAFRDDGTVKFTSYINNLHPTKHPEIYSLIEKLVDIAIPAWDRVLSCRPTAGEGGKLHQRFDLPPYVDEDDDDDLWEEVNPEIIAAHEKDKGELDYDEDELEYWENDEDEDAPDFEAKREKFITKLKWKSLRDPKLPEPLEFAPVAFEVQQSLRDRFKHTGLQVIVKMASVELTPEKPVFRQGAWHTEGMLNERIVATALFYVDSENVEPSRLSFRMLTDSWQEGLQARVAQNMYGLYERLYGVGLSGGDSATVQLYGDVETPEGRMLVFPNFFQHVVSQVRLKDRTKPGHRRFVALWLVDPHQRIVSTANVPPQRLDWWAEAVFGSGARADSGDLPPELFRLLLEQGVADAVRPPPETLGRLGRSRLPVEIMDLLRRYSATPDGLLAADEARRHRAALMRERAAFQRRDDVNGLAGGYSFCEH